MKLLLIFALASATLAQTRVSGNTSNSWTGTPVLSSQITVAGVQSGNLIWGCARWNGQLPAATVGLTDDLKDTYSVDSIGALAPPGTTGRIALWHTVAAANSALLTITANYSAPGANFWAMAAEQESTAAGSTWALDQVTSGATGSKNPVVTNSITTTMKQELATLCGSVAESTVSGTFGNTGMSVAQLDKPNGYIGLLDLPLSAIQTGAFSIMNADTSVSVSWGVLGATFSITPPVTPPATGAAFIPVRNEQPAYSTVTAPGGGPVGNYTLTHVPLYGVSCFIGTQRQFPVTYTSPSGSSQSAYTLTGKVITSAYWDQILGNNNTGFCDYEYAPGT